MTDETTELKELREENARLRAQRSDRPATAPAAAETAPAAAAERRGPPSEQDQDAASRASLSLGQSTEEQRTSDVPDHVHVGTGHGRDGDIATGGVYQARDKADTTAS